ncbi:class I SAM-dependent methyltransferase [Actinoplanes sp. NPDC051494]|uniref:class I SAM-dependent methyltransferase n=1 Tax=Actinoplanes sp. NPDC051494 TaxID=3363907 RepID=UPI0037B70368
MPSMVPLLQHERLTHWRRCWDEMMNGFMPGMREFEHAVASAAGTPARVLDIGGGPGVFAGRLSTRWPSATVDLLDLDPVLLALAEAGTGGAVTVHEADLGAPTWPAAVAHRAPFDLITVVMTLHYLPARRAAALYAEARSLLRPGGTLVVADLMPTGELPSMATAAEAVLAWERWWDEVGAALPPLMRRRRAVFATRPAADFTPDETWHLGAARAAGFDHAELTWRRGAHAAVTATA